jgi:hypothetical protein
MEKAVILVMIIYAKSDNAQCISFILAHEASEVVQEASPTGAKVTIARRIYAFTVCKRHDNG